MSKSRVRVASRSDVNEEDLLAFVRDGWIPIPRSIIPPKRTHFLWDTLEIQLYDSHQDYRGKLLDNLRFAIHHTIREWSDFERTNRVGVWLSGGVDSSTLLYLTCEALGADKVQAYSVDFGDQNEVERAKLIADWCNVRLQTKEMTAEDSIRLTEEAVLNQRGPTDTMHVLFASRLCRQDGTRKILSALGLDELQGGYPPHVNAGDGGFSEVEALLLWKCQSSYAWVQRIQSKRYVDVKFPFLDRELIAWCRALPRAHKCIDRETKVRLREELKAESLIPEKIIEAGRTAGTKGGFCPILERWFKNGLEEWCERNTPPNGLSSRARSEINEMIKRHLWRRWRAASINSFLSLLDEGKFNYAQGGCCKDWRRPEPRVLRRYSPQKHPEKPHD